MKKSGYQSKSNRPNPSALIGESPAMRSLRQRIRKIGESNIDVLVHGETGTGKELVAHHLHAVSGAGKLVIVNCAGIPESLLESELFGHVRGAFTGADRDRIGRFQAADGGTLFLDEIGELGLGVQAKLLRALDIGEVQRVGDDELRYVDNDEDRAASRPSARLSSNVDRTLVDLRFGRLRLNSERPRNGRGR